MRNIVDKQYTMKLVHILEMFSIIFCLENSNILKEDIIDLRSLEKYIKLNSEILTRF